MYHSQYEVFIYNVANCQLLLFLLHIEHQELSRVRASRGTGRVKAVHGAGAALNARHLPLQELLQSKHATGAIAAAGVAAEHSHLHTGSTGLDWATETKN